MSLRDYNRKRDFSKTAEPKGRATKKHRKLSFVIQKHDASHLHYDFRLEVNGVLKSWAVPKGPSLDPSQKRLAVQVEDHPLDYGDFEGTIPKGEYGGGTVMLWDKGEWIPDSENPLKDLKSGALKFELTGTKLKGHWKLFRMSRAGEKSWLLVKEKDAYSKSLREGDILEEASKSVKTGRDLDAITLKAPKKSRAAKTTPVSKRSAVSKSASLKLTHPDKIYYPAKGLKKRDLATYFIQFSDRMLEHVAGRPLMILRCPDGIGSACFHQKHWTESLPQSIKRVKVKGEEEPFFRIDSREGLVALAQLGVLEIHLWNTHFEHIEHPDQFVFDLDPDTDVPWKKVKDAALLLRDRLKKLGLKSFVKTTGGKGLHVVVPVMPKLDWELGLKFCKAFCDDIVSVDPKLFLTNMSKARRKGRIYLDYLRNGRGATAIAPYSPRAREGATISMPISWKDLESGTKNEDFDIAMRAEDLGSDPWKGFAGVRQFPRIGKK